MPVIRPHVYEVQSKSLDSYDSGFIQIGFIYLESHVDLEFSHYSRLHVKVLDLPESEYLSMQTLLVTVYSFFNYKLKFNLKCNTIKEVMRA